jgi:hypothetical protein
MSYGSPVLLEDVSFLQQPVLPLHMSILQQIVLLCICSVLPLDMHLFYTIQAVLLMKMSALQPPVLPLDMSIYYLSLSCPLMCLFTAVN